MPLPDQDLVTTTLSRLEPALRQIFLGAWDDWLESTEAGRSVYNRTRACIVWERLVARATQEFCDDPTIRIVEGHETKNFICDESVLFRFKKGDERGLSRNIPTQLALAYNDPDRDLFGSIKLQRVDIVYVLNGIGTAIESIQVVGRNGAAIAWCYDILERDEAVELEAQIDHDTVDGGKTASAVVRVKGCRPGSDKNRRSS